MTRSRARRAVLPATAALVLAISQASGALAVSPTLTVGANHDISRFADNEAETTVAVNPTLWPKTDGFGVALSVVVVVSSGIDAVSLAVSFVVFNSPPPATTTTFVTEVATSFAIATLSVTSG